MTNPAINGKVRIGVVGTGGIVTTAHLPVLSNMPDVVIAWVVDKDLPKARQAALSYKTQAFGEDIISVETPEVDVVLLAVPYGARAPYYDRFRGVSGWYIEKPFARTVAEHLARCRLAAGYRVACGFQRRASGMVQTLRRLLKMGIFGRPVRVEFGFGHRGRIVGGGSFEGDPHMAGGGALVEVGVHCIDAICYCLGANNAEIVGSRMLLDQGMDVHTEAELRLSTEAGGMVELGFVVSNLANTTERIAFLFEQAEVSFSLFGEPSIRLRGRAGDDQLQLSGEHWLLPKSNDQIFHEFWREYLQSLHTGERSIASAADMWLTTRIVELLTETSGA